MKRIVATFNVPFYGVDAYQAGQVLADLKNVQGVLAVRFFQATEGTPRYALEIECADEAVDAVAKEATAKTEQYSEYISDLTVRIFRQLA